MPDQLTRTQFDALRSWAMSYTTTRKVGAGTWPVFRYTGEQEQRLIAIARAVPPSTRLFWLILVAILWFVAGFLIAFVPILPLIYQSLPPHRSQVANVLLWMGIAANLVSAFVLGSLVATWVAGRITESLLPARPLEQARGDAALLARIRQHGVRVAIFGLIVAALPTFMTFIVRME